MDSGSSDIEEQWTWSGAREFTINSPTLYILGMNVCVGEPAAVQPVGGGVVDRADRRDQDPRLYYLPPKLSGTGFTM